MAASGAIIPRCFLRAASRAAAKMGVFCGGFRCFSCRSRVLGAAFPATSRANAMAPDKRSPSIRRSRIPACKAQDALQAGILDRLIDGDLLSGAIAFAREVAGKAAPKTRERQEKHRKPPQKTPIFAAAREAARKKQRGMMAPLAAIDAVEAATKLSFEEGCQREQKLFLECLFSDQSRALIHVFFGEREVARIPDVPKETPVLPVNNVAIVGAGTMAGGIAMGFTVAGIPVLLHEVDYAALDRGLANIQKN